MTAKITHLSTVSANMRNKSGNGGGGDMETRIAKLESDVEYIKNDILDIKTELRGHSEDFKAIRSDMNSEFKSVRSEIHNEFKSVRSEIGGVKKDLTDIKVMIPQLQVKMLIWGVGIVFSAVGLGLAAARYMFS
ncbi:MULTISPECIES: hypothetical protein [Pseudoalteromonas]|uniref:hypothetical protein n=1 Tax=Pseudoalteromonas TaxID=53246 RepID=UPI00249CAFD9|nr:MULTISPECIES: hypothetical protein [Pseudoalteromonas]MDI3246913.1 hypothetical protein [Pseudoalteromonas agarivorans]WRU71770.1 hypothetical protein VOI46_09515 [Pseudoalteromonas sp. CuT 4-3]